MDNVSCSSKRSRAEDEDIGETTEPSKEKEGTLTHPVFSIQLVFKDILKCLNIPDLLRTSLVNKHWNFYSREVLREVKNCLAIIQEENSCRDLRKLNELVVSSFNVPFNGLSISVPWSDRDHKCVLYEDLTELTSSLLTNINIKYLSIDCERPTPCVTLQCIQKIMEERAPLLEGLCVDQIPYSIFNFSQFLGLDVEGPWLPNLKTLEFPYELQEEDTPENVIQELVEAAPKLQKLYGNINHECLEFLSKRAHVVKEFYLRASIGSFQAMQEFVLQQPKLSKLRFSTAEEDEDDGSLFTEWSPSNQEKLCQIGKLLLLSCQNSLEKLALNQLDLILMTQRWDSAPLKGLEHITIGYNPRIDIHGGFSKLRAVDFSKHFPNLKEVCITNDRLSRIDYMFYIDEALRLSPEHSCPTVTKFSMSRVTNLWDVEQLSIFQHLFPNVKHFYLAQCREVAFILTKLWATWPELETISLNLEEFRSMCRNPVYDHVFLGILPAEAEMLAKAQDLHLMQIVPLNPSILDLRKLKKLSLLFNHSRGTCKENTRAVELFSPLAVHCVFGRMPGLVVEIERDLCPAKEECCLAMSHLKSFVKFVSSVESHISF